MAWTVQLSVQSIGGGEGRGGEGGGKGGGEGGGGEGGGGEGGGGEGATMISETSVGVVVPVTVTVPPSQFAAMSLTDVVAMALVTVVAAPVEPAMMLTARLTEPEVVSMTTPSTSELRLTKWLRRRVRMLWRSMSSAFCERVMVVRTRIL